MINYNRALEELDTARKVASKGKELFDKTKELVWDELQLTGQCEVLISLILTFSLKSVSFLVKLVSRTTKSS